jgi:DNA-binding transcriptional ArsR family regulator
MVPPVSGRQELKPAQQRAMKLLREGRETELTRGAYEEIFGVSRSQAAYDLAELVEAGLVERVGGGRSTRYVLVHEPNSTRRHWTSERIRAELADFCAGRPAWPSVREFKAAGHADLYVAASRYGGVAFWAAELGLPRAVRRWETPALPRLRLSLSWAMIGALGGALAVGAAVGIVQGFPRGAPTAVADQAGTVAAAKSTSGKTSRPPKAKPTKPATQGKAKTKAAHRTTAHKSTAEARPAVKRTSTAATAVLAVRTVSPPSPPAPSTTRTSTPTRSTGTASSSTGGGPTPLTAPAAGSGTPAPLPPPTR